jgi:phosphoribosyl 1,2-cyclic phosphate phosphodiesterase
MKAIILGCGDSYGVPRIGNDWGKCDPTNPKNRRTRPSLALKTDQTTLIIDTGPDFRDQLNRHNISNVDAIFYTHHHSDHVSGIDDVRALFDRRGKIPVPIYGTDETFADLKIRTPYIFKQKSDLYPATVITHIIKNEDFFQPILVGDIEVIPFPQIHGDILSLGFLVGDLAYSTDLNDLPIPSKEFLKGRVRTWILDAGNFYFENILVHLNYKTIQSLQDQIQPTDVYLTHMKHDCDFQELSSICEPPIKPAYDGLEITIHRKK